MLLSLISLTTVDSRRKLHYQVKQGFCHSASDIAQVSCTGRWRYCSGGTGASLLIWACTSYMSTRSFLGQAGQGGRKVSFIEHRQQNGNRYIIFRKTLNDLCGRNKQFHVRIGKSRFTVVSTQNTEFILVLWLSSSPTCLFFAHPCKWSIWDSQRLADLSNPILASNGFWNV